MGNAMLGVGVDIEILNRMIREGFTNKV